MDVLYLFTIPIVHAFNFSQVLILPLLVAIIGLGVRIAQGKVPRIPWIDLDAYILWFILSILISIVVNIGALGPKTFNHFVALITGYVFFYFGAERILQFLTVEKILKILYYSYIITAAFGIFEFGIVNFTDFDLNKFVFRPHILEYTPTFLDLLLTRSRSFFEESGYFSGYLAVMTPLLYYYLWWVKPNRFHQILFIVLSFGAYFVVFSANLFIFMPCAILLTACIKSLAERRLSRNTIVTFCLFAILVVAMLSSDVAWNLLIGHKLEGDSLLDRTEKFEGTMKVMQNAGPLNLLFGFGPGSYEILGVKPAISVFLNYLRDLGVFGICAYLAQSAFLLLRLFQEKTRFGMALFVSALLTQLFFISTPIYYFPHYFLPLLLYRIGVLRQREEFRSVVENGA